MKSDVFLKLDGIKGEAQDDRHRDEIQVREWNWSASQPANLHMGAGGGAGKASIHDLTFTHEIDCATPNLMRYCVTGKPIKKAVLTMRKAGGNPLPYFRITMHDAIVVDVTPGISEKTGEAMEVVSLAFTRIEQEYTLQNAQGGSAGAICAGFDVKANKEL